MKPPNAQDRIDARVLAQQLRDHGYVYIKVAKRLKIHGVTMSAYLTGKRQIPYCVQYAIEALLEANLYTLKRFNPDKPRSPHLSRIRKAMSYPLPAASIPAWWNDPQSLHPTKHDTHSIDTPQNNHAPFPPIHDQELPD